MPARTGTAHVVTTTRKYKDQVYRTHLLRRSYREGGTVKNGGLMEPYLRPERVAGLWADHLSGRRDHAYALWPIVHFLQWRETTGAR